MIMDFSETGLPQDERLEKAFARFAARFEDPESDEFFQEGLEVLKLVADSHEKPPVSAMCA